MEIEIVGASRSMQKNIKVAIAGVGNCASALVQGVEYYRDRQGAALEGIMRHSIGGYKCSDVEFVAAFDIDRRKVGHPLEEAIFAKPNCTRIFQSALPVSNVIVQAGPVLDGVAEHMADYPDDAAFRSADLEPTDVAAALRASGAEILVCYLPVGSEQAVKHYAQACLDARVAMINCVPVFLASDHDLGAKISGRGRPDRRRRYQKPGRGDHRTSGTGAAVRRPRSWARSDLSTQYWRQYRLPQHVGARVV